MALLRFLGSTPGRGVRAAAGVAMIAVGLVLGGGWTALALAGVLPLAAGVFDFCLIAPLAKLPFGGKAFRHAATLPDATRAPVMAAIAALWRSPAKRPMWRRTHPRGWATASAVERRRLPHDQGRLT